MLGQEQAAPQAAQYVNVLESRALYDTILVSDFLVIKNKKVEGWHNSFADLAQANDLYFFNIRNRSVGIAYNNQDKRDAMPWAMRMQSFGVAFIGPTIKDIWTMFEGSPVYEQVQDVHFWENDLPNHCSIEFSVSQDEHISQPVLLCPPGYGMTGGGYGRERDSTDLTNPYLLIKGAVNQGIPDLTNRWPFPGNLEVPRDCAISAKIKISEYAKEILRAMNGPGYIVSQDELGAPKAIASAFAIQVSIFGEALIQQRGAYHK